MSSFCLNESSSVLYSPFSDQTHLRFYNCAADASNHFFSARPQRFRLKAASLSLQALCNSGSADVQQTTQESLMQELAELKLQLDQKKLELKAHMKEEKKKSSKSLESKEERKTKKMARKAVKAEEKKMKGRCTSESSLGSESSDGGCESLSMDTLRQGNSVDMDGREAKSRFHVEETGRMLSRCVSGCKDESEQQSPNPDFDMDRTTGNPAFMDMSGKERTSSAISALPNQTGGSQLRSRSDLPCRGPTSNWIEVCAGGKCKKAGSEQLLLALRGQIPGSSGVMAVPCKCMGKCAMAINVRVHREDSNPQHHSHVGVEDSGLILSHHFGLGRPASGLPMCLSMKPKIAPMPVPAV